MSQTLFAFRWYLVVQAFGLAALPLCLRLFRHLPDRGYGVSKPLGLLLAGWAFWLLTTFGWLHNTAGGVLVALTLLLAAAGLALQLTNHPPNHPTTQSPSLPVTQSPSHPITQLPWRTILFTEAVFALTFTTCCLVRAYMPRIETTGGEKWMEIAFLRAILRSDTFPPHDPWLSGFAISYYYFGYLIVSMLIRLAAVPPAIAFNLGIATLFALACTGAFSLVYNLVAAKRQSGEVSPSRFGEGPAGEVSPSRFGEGPAGQVSSSRFGEGPAGETSPPRFGEGPAGETSPPRFGEGPGERFAILAGLLGPLLLAAMGNLEGLLEMLHVRGIGLAGFWAWLDIRGIDGPPPLLAEGSWVPTRSCWWWQASRVLQDYAPWGAEQEVIDEFPAFSFILGDMHPHVLALPFVLLALALALNLYRRASLKPETWDLKLLRWTIPFPLRPWELFIYALCLGGLGFLNTWDFPIYLFIVVAAYALAQLRTTHHVSRITHHASRITHHASRITFLFLALLVTALLLYLPFWLSFQSQAGGVLPNLFNGARLPQYLVMFGPLIFIASVFVINQARRGGVQARDVVRRTLVVAPGILSAFVLVLGLIVILVWLDVISPQGPAAYLAAWLSGGPIPGLEGMSTARSLISRGLLLRLLTPWVSLGLIAFLVVIVLTLTRDTQRATRDTTRDTQHASSIRNSQFAIRNFVLLLFATGALLTLVVEFVYLRDQFGTRMNSVFKFYFQAWVLWAIAGAYALADFVRRGRVGVVIPAALLIAAGLVYPALAIPARAREYGAPPTLDGAAYLSGTQPDDYAAITWLNENVGGAPVILEAPGDHLRAYVYEGRVSAHTGLPTLLGWAGHEYQWRGNYDEQARREPDIETLYTSVDADEVLTLLDRYDISYVYVGPVERARYPAAGLAKFAQLMQTVYDTGTVTIYRVDK